MTRFLPALFSILASVAWSRAEARASASSGETALRPNARLPAAFGATFFAAAFLRGAAFFFAAFFFLAAGFAASSGVSSTPACLVFLVDAREVATVPSPATPAKGGLEDEILH